ncbi:GPW/gp25 family protein [Paracoccus sp. TOH]|uniref:GPW/gp25 family protein n=1 Tax=Paracoccus simplex TaxID=2086346 RepID=A0ABV7S725_9RHOB|nr:GPW/gp25 family protein [Paracoccus sp. TOH]WJS85998.1 GPW/gp25 family protein [Paracoccus sp. TOH]
MTDLSAPFRIDGTGRTATTGDARRHARDLIEAVLFTAPGERVNRPDFGSGLLEMLFDTNNQALETAADFLIQTAIQKHLSEILTVSELSLRRDEGLLEIALSYVLRDTGETVSDTFRREV